MNDLLTKGTRVLQQEGFRSFLAKSSRFAWLRLLRAISYQIRSTLPSVYYSLAEWWYRKKKDFDTDHWEAPLNPYKLVWVSPDRITKMTSRCPNLPIEDRIEKFGEVKEGDWDISSDMNYASWRPDQYGENKWIYDLLIERKFEQTTFFKSAKKHFHAGIPWEDTEFHDEMMSRFESGKKGMPAYGTNMDEFKQSLEDIDALYNSVRKKGVLPEERINNKPFDYTINDSILVDIARDGEFLFVEGRRRLTVAKLLNIDTVPVRIQVRHRDWMEFRDRVYKNEIDEEHPDFSEFN